MARICWASIIVFACCTSRVSAEKPDVLFIAIDDLNDWTGCLGGHPQASTPHIDALAARGMLFTRAYCAAPACNPSRAALMTGQAPWRSGVYVNPQPWRPAMKDAVTLPQHFMQHGYWAGGSGKIYHGAFPDPASWHEYYPSKKNQTPSGVRVQGTPFNGIPNTRHFDWGPIPDSSSAMSDYKVAQWVTKKLREPSAKPRFLACGIFRPHLPWYVPEKYFAAGPTRDEVQLPKTLKTDLNDVPAGGLKMAKPQGDHKRVRNHDQWPGAVRAYLASIRFADEMVGQVLSALKASGREDKTIVVLWTDHGWHLGEKQHWRKFALWERATRVPLIVVVPPGLSDTLPAGVTAGARCERPVSLLDVYPTLSDLCGLSQAEGPLDGHSLLPLLKDPEAEPERAVVTTHGRNNHAVRSGRFRYIRYADGGEELYDMTKDPHEWTNLASQNEFRETIARLKKHLPTINAANARQTKRKNSTSR